MTDTIELGRDIANWVHDRKPGADPDRVSEVVDFALDYLGELMEGLEEEEDWS